MKTIDKLKLRTAITALGIALALPALADDKEGKDEEVKLVDCPAAVQKAIKDNAGSGQVIEVEKETMKDGSVVYEAKVKQSDGKKAEIKVSADGKLLKADADDDDEDEEGDDEKENK